MPQAKALGVFAYASQQGSTAKPLEKALLVILAAVLVASIVEALRTIWVVTVDYTYFCGQLESMFMSPVVTALEEYGVPIQLGQRLMPILGNPETLDDALAALAKRRVQELAITPFERALVRPLCRDEASANSQP